MAVFLILVTWVVWVCATWGIGLALASRLVPNSRLNLRAHAQLGVWVGLFVLVTLTVSLNFFVPLAGIFGQWVALGWIMLGIALLARWLYSHRLPLVMALQRALTTRNFIPLIIVGLLAASALVAAWFAAAEPMDYDAGLYRMGIINYAAEYRAIPGLANLHSRFGFSSALGPFSAFMGNGIWENNGFRIVTGFVFSLLLLEVALRIMVPRKRTPGDFLIVLGGAFTVWVMLGDSGRWVSSPSQDLMALITALIAFVFLVDFVSPQTRQRWLASGALLTAAISASIRPLSWLLVLCLLLTIYLASIWLKPRERIGPVAYLYLLPSLIAVFVLGVVMMVRDAIISGWLLFPLTAFPFPVDWRAASPKADSLGVTWWGRAPGVSIDQAQAQGWFGPWLDSFISGREMRFFVVAIAASVIPLLWLAGRQAWRRSWGGMAFALSPALVVTTVWFVTAPDIRFGWAGLIALAGIPIAFLLAEGAYPPWLCRAIFFIFVALGVASTWRAGQFEQRGNEPQPYSLNMAGREVRVLLGPPNYVYTVPGSLGDGTPVVYPRDGENCYMAFPLCLLPGGGANIEKRGSSISEGFRVIP
jgi:hypothetical protein